MIGAYLVHKIHKISSSECLWCGSGERQSRYHVFVRSRAWLPQSRAMRRSVRVEASAGAFRQTALSERMATTAVLAFLRETKVGRIVSLAALGGGEEGEAPARTEVTRGFVGRL